MKNNNLYNRHEFDRTDERTIPTTQLRKTVFGCRLRQSLLALLPSLLLATVVQAQEPLITSSTASSTLSGWPLSSAFDGNAGTVWSSVIRPSANSTESISYWFSGFNNINYIRLTPRFSGTNALGFPVTYSIYYSNGTSWQLLRTVTDMQRPYRTADIILPFGTVSCNGISIVASKLGTDAGGNFLFQLAEARAGYNVDFATKMAWVGSGSPAGSVEVRNVVARNFNPNRLANDCWHYDARNPILAPSAGTWRNIYAPSAVNNGPNLWNIYFGGWDGSATGNDRISLTVTGDRFNTFGTRPVVINNGTFIHVNNETVVKVGPNDWRMAYTTVLAGAGQLNKPCYATSTNGLAWTPSAGSSSYRMTMTGYANWATADVNGSNVIYYDGSLYHMYFTDFANFGGTFHATSTNNINYTYVNQVMNAAIIANDMKKFTFNSADQFIWGYHRNRDYVRYSIGPNPSNAGTGVADLFTYKGTADRYITSCGFVQEANKLIGCLYGASSSTSLTQNQIFARWLQRKVVFNNSSIRWGDIEDSVGPDKVRFYTAAGQYVETGTFKVYAEDGVTLEYTSPNVTMLSGDIWESRY